MKKDFARKRLITIRRKKVTTIKDLKREDPLVELPVLELNPTQLFAAKLVAQGTLTDLEIADQCKISRQLLSKWKSMPEFIIEVRNKLNQYDKIDRESREKVHKDILMPAFTELQNRIANGDLKHMKITTLKNFIVDMSEQLRLDSGEATVRTGHEDLEEIQKRFNERNIEDVKKSTIITKKAFKKSKVKEIYSEMGLGKVKKAKINDVSKYFK